MDFLKNAGIKKEVIEYLNNNLDSKKIESYHLAYNDILSSIDFFRSIGVSEDIINELVKKYINSLVCGRKIFENAFKYINKDIFLTKIKEDVDYITFLEEYKYL